MGVKFYLGGFEKVWKIFFAPSFFSEEEYNVERKRWKSRGCEPSKQAGLNSSRRPRRVRYWIKAVTFPRVNKSRGAGSFLCHSPSVRRSRTGRIRSALLRPRPATGQSNSSHFESQREPLVTLDSVKLNVNTVRGGEVLPIVRLSRKTGHEEILSLFEIRGVTVDSKQSFLPAPIPSQFFLSFFFFLIAVREGY